MSTKPNPTISVSPSFLLHALLNSPEKALHFVDTAVYLKHRDLQSLQAITSVRLHFSYLEDHGPEYELAVELKNPPHNTAQDKNHPFLQTKSTNTLYQPLNPPKPSTLTSNPLLPLYQPLHLHNLRNPRTLALTYPRPAARNHLLMVDSLRHHPRNGMDRLRERAKWLSLL